MGSEKRKTWSAIKSAAFRRAVAKIERLTAELEQAKRHAFRAGALWTLERVQDEISRARTALAAPELSEECSPVTLAHLVLTANEIAQAAQEYRDVRREIEAGMAGPGVTVGAENKTPEQDMADFSALVERERRAAKRLDAALAAREDVRAQEALEELQRLVGENACGFTWSTDGPTCKVEASGNRAAALYDIRQDEANE